MSQEPAFVSHPSGVIEFHGENFTEIYYPWSHPKGFVVDGIQRNSQGYLRPCCLPHILERRSPFEGIHDSIPSLILRAVLSLPEGHYGLLRLTRRHDIEAIRLMNLNPLLALALSRHPDEGRAMEMVTKPWREIVRFCGLPGGKDTARILSRMRRELITHTTLLEFERLPERRRRMLGYLSQITTDAWQCVRQLPNEAVSVPLLKAASTNYRGTLYHDRAQEIIQLRRALMLRPTWPYRRVIATIPIQRITERINRLRRDGHRSGSLPNEPLPPPPFPPIDQYNPVTDSNDLIWVAKRFECCVEDYYRNIQNGHCSVWWNELGIEPHVVLLVQYRGVWMVDQVRGRGNSPVSEVTYEAAKKVFHGRRAL